MFYSLMSPSGWHIVGAQSRLVESMTATSSTPRSPGKAESLEAKHRKGWGKEARQPAGRFWEAVNPEDVERARHWPEGKGKFRLLPPQMTSYWHMIERTGLTQQLVTGRQAGSGRGRPPREQSPPSPHLTSVYSQQRLFGVQTLHIPALGAYQFIR